MTVMGANYVKRTSWGEDFYFSTGEASIATHESEKGFIT